MTTPNYKNAQVLAVDNLIVKHLAGSHAYGTNVATSDVDYRGVFVADPINVRTPFYRVDEVEITSEEDTKLYELSNFMKLASDCNPNVVETLWVDMNDVVKMHPAYQIMRDAAPALLNKNIAFTTSGYALSQLKRIRGHNKWLTQEQQAVNSLACAVRSNILLPNEVKDEFPDFIFTQVMNRSMSELISNSSPDWILRQKRIVLNTDDVMLIRNIQPQAVDFVSMVQHFVVDGEKPTMPREFNLRNHSHGWRLIPFGHDTYGLYKMEGYSPFNVTSGNLNDFFENESRAELGAPEYVVKFNRQEYSDAKVRWEQYHTWKANRNVARSELEKEFGYDTKHAMHLVRLLRMGYEAVTEGVIRVKRPDAAELLAIRSGSWTYDQLIEYATDMDDKVKQLAQTCNLPKRPNVELAAKIVMDVQDAMWNG